MDTTSAYKSYESILAKQIEEGEKQIERTAQGLFFSSFSAGLDIGFGPLLMAVLTTLAAGMLDGFTMDLLHASAYTVGFVFVVLGRTDLFTELDVQAAFPVIDGRSSVTKLLRLWGLVIAGNLIGGVLFAFLAVQVGTAYGIVEPHAFAELATVYTERSTFDLFLGAIIAGWLMGLLAWLIAGARETFSVIFLVGLTTGSIALMHLPHSIAGNVEVFMGLLVDPAIGGMDYARFLAASIVGNALGGIVFVTLLKFGGEPRTSS